MLQLGHATGHLIGRGIQACKSASEEKKAAMAVILRAKQEKQKAEARALKAGRREASLAAGS